MKEYINHATSVFLQDVNQKYHVDIDEDKQLLRAIRAFEKELRSIKRELNRSSEGGKK